MSNNNQQQPGRFGQQSMGVPPQQLGGFTQSPMGMPNQQQQFGMAPPQASQAPMTQNLHGLISAALMNSQQHGFQDLSQFQQLLPMLHQLGKNGPMAPNMPTAPFQTPLPGMQAAPNPQVSQGMSGYPQQPTPQGYMNQPAPNPQVPGAQGIPSR